MDSRYTLGALGGIFMLVNVNLVPWASTSPRITDALGILLLGVLGWQYATGQLTTRLSLRYVLLAAFPGFWVALGILVDDLDTVFRGLRWLTGLAWGIALYQLALSERGRHGIAVGLVVGALGNTAVLSLQMAGYTDLLTTLGVLPQDAARRYVNGRIRYAGIGGMANATMAMVSVGVPASLYLVLAKRRSILWFVGAGISLGAATWMTYTRSPLVVAAVTVSIALASRVALREGRLAVPRRIVQFTSALAVGAASFLVVVGPPGGWNRWTDLSRLHGNLADRVHTTTTSAEIAFAQPLGYGAGNPGIPTTHNAFTQAMIEFGVVFGLVLAALIGLTAAGVWVSKGEYYDLAALVAVHLVGVFFFEMHLNNPTFVILAAWVLITGFDIAGSTLKAGRKTPSTT